ncbi:MAG: hypothetical protein NUV45_04625 [Tepidanaerobacteraceae bacterium]|nr:hypothetical protein [Tepidanaerobacteraceae bacterium]
MKRAKAVSAILAKKAASTKFKFYAGIKMRFMLKLCLKCFILIYFDNAATIADSMLKRAGAKCSPCPMAWDQKHVQGALRLYDFN